MKGLREPIAKSTHTRAGTLFPSRAPAAITPYCRRGEVYSVGGREQEERVKSSGERTEDLDSEYDLDNMTEVGPPVPPATREAPEAEPGAGAAGVRKVTPRQHRSPPGGTVASTAAVAAVATTTAAPAVTAATATTAGTFPRSWGPARNLEVFGELPALQSGRTRSQSQGLTMSASYVDALLVYTMRAVEAKKTMEKKAAESERAHDSLLEERLEK